MKKLVLSTATDPKPREYTQPQKSDSPEGISPKWWNQTDPHTSVFALLERLSNNHQARQLQYMMDAWLYQGQDMLTFQPGSSGLLQRGWADQNLKFNVIKSCVDTLQNKISKNNPMVYFLTKRGNFKQQKRARQLTKFLMGLFDKANVYAEAQLVFRDAEVFGTGALYYEPDAENKTIRVERVLPDELLVDELEALHGKPRQIHRRKYVSKDLLMAKFPEKSGEISIAADTILPGSNSIADVVLVVESWYLGTTGENNPGKHSINIEACNLLHEEYQDKDFPFVFFKWDEPLDGFYGLGLVNTLQPIQMEITQTMRSIQLGLYYFAVPRIVIEQNSQVDTGQMTNTIDGQVISYVGTPPKFESPVAVMSGDTYKWVSQLIEWAYNVSGVSQLSANSQNPLGADASGAALRTYHQIETERYVNTGQRWERFFVDLGKRLVGVAAKMYKDGDNISVSVPGSAWLKEVSWKDVSLDADLYTLQAFPSAMLSNDPAGKLQEVQELMQAGLIPPEMGLALLGLPDVDAATALLLCNFENSAEKIDAIVSDGIMQEINPNQDLNILLTMASQTSVLVELDKEISEENKELLEQFILKIKDLLMQAAPPPAPMAPGAQPIAQPEAPPTSQLLPAVA